MYIHAHLLYSVIIDIEDTTKRATALCSHVHKITEILKTKTYRDKISILILQK